MALVATRSLGLAFLKRESTTLDAGTLSALQTRAEVLWTKHIQERAADEQPKGFRLGAPVVERVPGSGHRDGSISDGDTVRGYGDAWIDINRRSWANVLHLFDVSASDRVLDVWTPRMVTQ